ncbi:outer dynein arm-docking complex subunit 4 isoform X2 [Betta splendens]|uniref:Outer dynein arm-docking complex subunit 4 n=1 Tax=Betta splendens TaxID=158456 RepID=A0A6P7NC73_BETSP|nr:outer dynein arm-docking complex subunit 4 isoform X2 [Betta splendens]
MQTLHSKTTSRFMRGQKLRPQMQEFRLGIQKAQEAIENAIGCPTKVKLEINGDLSFLQNDEEGAKPINAIQHLIEERKQPLSMAPKKEKIAKHLLGEFYSDKKYLENLLKDEDLIKGKSGKKLKDIVQNSLTYLDTCTEFWTQEKNIYAQDKDRKPTQQRCSKPQHVSGSEPAQVLLRSLQDIDAELTSGNAKGSLKKAEEAMKAVQGWPDKEISKKREAIGSLHSCIGNALIELGNINKALEHHQKDLELAEQCKLPEAMSRALENTGRVYAQMGRFEQAIEVWERKVPLLSGGLEKTWLFHELGWCHLKLSHHEKSQDYGIRSVAAAEEIADEEWLLNAHVLVAQSEIKLGNFESCVAHFERALTYARLKENNCAMTGILKALDEAKQQLPQ